MYSFHVFNLTHNSEQTRTITGRRTVVDHALLASQLRPMIL